MGQHIVVVPAMQDRRLEEVAFSARLDYRDATPVSVSGEGAM